MIARCRLFSHTCVVPSSSTLSSHCSFSLSLPLSLRFTGSKTARGKRRIFESRLSPSNAPLFFFLLLFSISIHHVRRKGIDVSHSVDKIVPFYSPKDGSARQFFHRSAGNGIRSERKSKKVIRRRKKRDLWGEQRVSLVRNVPSRDFPLFARKRFSISRRYSI